MNDFIRKRGDGNAYEYTFDSMSDLLLSKLLHSKKFSLSFRLDLANFVNPRAKRFNNYFENKIHEECIEKVQENDKQDISLELHKTIHSLKFLADNRFGKIGL
jgi:hypothetical protein